MTARRLLATVLLCLAAACAATCAGAVAAETPLGRGASGLDGLRPVPVADVEARVERAEGEAAGIRVAFAKGSGPRRFLALEARVDGVPAGAAAVALRYRLKIDTGETPRLAAALWERGGGMWFKVCPTPVVMGAGVSASSDGFVDGRVSLGSLREAAFSEDPSGELERANVERVWVGLVLPEGDGATSGTFELRSARLTDAPYRPDRPLGVTGGAAGAGRWSMGKDPAVAAELTKPSVKIDGGPARPCMDLTFRFPGGRHMYVVPQTPVPAAELEGYAGLRFTYRATLPPGIGTLLVMLVEQNGAQYLADPAPRASAEWTTVTIPLEKFHLGGWSRDPSGRLEPTEIAHVAIACHGQASGAGGEGAITVTDIEFVP